MVTVWFGVGQFFPGDFGSIISRRWQFGYIYSISVILWNYSIL